MTVCPANYSRIAIEMGWCCYLLGSLGPGNTRTYIGASPNPQARLTAHNRNDIGRKRQGAKATQGQAWMHLAVVSGFPTEKAALSFEWHWKYLARGKGMRKADRLCATGQDPPFLRHSKDVIDAKILDLLFLTHTHTLFGDQYKYNRSMRYPQVDYPLQIELCVPIHPLHWPAHVTVGEM